MRQKLFSIERVRTSKIHLFCRHCLFLIQSARWQNCCDRLLSQIMSSFYTCKLGDCEGMSDGAEMAGPSVNEIEWKEEENILFMVSDIQPGFRFLLYNFPSMGGDICRRKQNIQVVRQCHLCHRSS